MVAKFGLAQDALEAEPESGDDEQRLVVVGRGRHADPVRAHLVEGEIESRAGRFGHEPAPRGFLAEPIAELARAMQMYACLEPHDADERAPRALAHGEAHGS